jgi:molybdenum cofactor biosynthesis enzyme MoaA
MVSSVAQNKEAILQASEERSLKVDAVPFFYALHPTMNCNMRCIMCRPDGRHPASTLPFDQMAALLAQFQPFAECITLTGGEPLLYPWIDDVIELLARSRVSVSITTNASLLTKDRGNKLIRLTQLDLKCSIDAATAPTYHKIRGVDQFARVLANLMTFATLARDQPHIRLILVYVVMRENLGEVLDFVDLARGLNPYRIEFHPVRHVVDWIVDNGTGWVFRGVEQCCEFLRHEYDKVMDQAAAMCREEGLRCETLRV